jgi:hypothetical protein
MGKGPMADAETGSIDVCSSHHRESSMSINFSARRALAVIVICAAASGGCSTSQFRSPTAGARQKTDPLVMAHLTHSKEDPQFAGTENGTHFDSDSTIQAAVSQSRKSSYTTVADDRTAGSPPVRPIGRAFDYSWLEGRLAYRSHRRAGWYLRYAPAVSNDLHGGELLLENDPRLAMFREGDRVYVEGAIVSHQLGDQRYRVESISLRSDG